VSQCQVQTGIEAYLQVFYDLIFPNGQSALVEGMDLEAGDEEFESSSFPYFPYVAWNVKRHGLEEKHETNPLVIAMKELPVFLPQPLNPGVGLGKSRWAWVAFMLLRTLRLIYSTTETIMATSSNLK